MPIHKFISLRDSLKGAVVDFLEEEKMACLKTQDGLVEIINALSYYREEGHVLFPEIFIMDNLPSVFDVLPMNEHVYIGEGPKNGATLSKALKQCAPLAQGGWAIYIYRKNNAFEYGLFRTGSTMLSVSIEETLVNKGDPSIPVLMVHQISEKIVEVRGFLKSCLLVNFGVTKEGDASPLEALERFVQIIISSAPVDLKELVYTFYSRLLSRIIKESHGTLAAVVSDKKRKIPNRMRDSIILNPVIDVIGKIRDLNSSGDARANTRLEACATLITGMMLSDGITIFGTDGTVRAYNAFIKHPRDAKSLIPLGGARSRTYEVLCSMVGKDLVGAFMQSQDGKAEFKGADNE